MTFRYQVELVAAPGVGAIRVRFEPVLPAGKAKVLACALDAVLQDLGGEYFATAPAGPVAPGQRAVAAESPMAVAIAALVARVARLEAEVAELRGGRRRRPPTAGGEPR